MHGPSSHVPYKGDEEPQRRDGSFVETRRTAQRPSTFQDPSSYSAMRFQVKIGTIDSSVPSAVQTWFQNTLLPATTAYLAQLLRVNPVAGKLYFARRCASAYSNGKCASTDTTATCGPTTVPTVDLGALTLYDGYGNPSTTHSAGSGGYSADYIVYVTSTEAGSCSGGSGTLAYAGSCRYDQYDRPVAGYINFCPGHLSSIPTGSDYNDILATSIHEVTHALGFSSGRYAYFWDHATGQPRTGRININAAIRPSGEPGSGKYSNFAGSGNTIYVPGSGTLQQYTERGHTVWKLTTPQVLYRARERFGCWTLNGAELEEGGGSGERRSLLVVIQSYL